MNRLKLRKGDRVDIFAPKDKHYLGEGVFLKWERIGTLDGRALTTPIFRLGRKKIGGYECWWVPMKIGAQAYAALHKLKDVMNPAATFGTGSNTSSNDQLSITLPTFSNSTPPRPDKEKKK